VGRPLDAAAACKPLVLPEPSLEVCEDVQTAAGECWLGVP
jgi:hypothetical protein